MGQGADLSSPLLTVKGAALLNAGKHLTFEGR